MLTLQHLHNPAEAAAAAVSGGGQAELLDRLDCGVKILSGESTKKAKTAGNKPTDQRTLSQSAIQSTSCPAPKGVL